MGPPKSGMAVFVGKAKTGKSIGTAAVPAAAPTPLNTPSLKRENGGKDPTVAIIPTGSSAVWGNSSSNNDRNVPSPPNDQSPSTWRASSSSANTTSGMVKPAPWAKGDGKPDVVDNSHVESRPVPSASARSRAKSWADDDSEEEEEDVRPSNNNNQHDDSQPPQQPDQWPNNFREDIDSHHGPHGGGGYGRGDDGRGGSEFGNKFGPGMQQHGRPNNMNRGVR